jgi:glycosyltransferase involved in cell wall biosynthesis
MAKVSIIIPTYNVEQYLRECLESVINQTLQDIEIVCVDDGSKDTSGQILDEYAAKDSRIKVIHKENGGYGKAMNVGLDNATGEYIGIVEPDDYVELDMYNSLYNIAKEYDLDLIKSDFNRFVDKNGERIFTYNKLDKSDNYYNRVLNAKADFTPFYFIMNTWCGIYKRSFLEKYHIRHNETPGASFQDNGFWFQTFCRADRMYFMDIPYYLNRRDNPNSSVKSKEKVFCMKEEYDYIKSILEAEPELKKSLIGVYSYKRFQNYMFTYDRVDISFKKLFLKTFQKDFAEAYKNGEIDESIFNEKELKVLHTIVKKPMTFYRKSLHKLSFFEIIFSLKNQGTHKVLTICGMKFKFKNKKKIEQEKWNRLENSLRQIRTELKIVNTNYKILLTEIQKDFDNQKNK